MCSILILSSASHLSVHAALPKLKQTEEAMVSEREIYQQLTVAYEQNDLDSFRSKYSRLQKEYTNSIYLDDAEYMLGMMFAGRKDYGLALKTFNEALKKYPTSNRLRTLLLSKGTTLKRMNLNELALIQFEQVKKKFPGSPEALRSDVELKLIRQ
jgi:TolA-binding protein